MMIELNRKTYLFWCLVLVLVLYQYVRENKNAEHEYGVVSHPKLLASTEVKKALSRQRQMLNQNEILDPFEETYISGSLRPIVLINEDEIRDWQAKTLGYYYSGAIPSDYDNYDLDTLILMGEQGDLRALDMLAYKYLIAKNYSNARQTYIKSAVLGSTFALKQLGTMESNSSSSTNGQPRARSINRLAYYQAGILRGDTQLLMNASATIEFLDVELTEEEKNSVQAKGLLIYRQLEKARKDLGLSPFENEIPEYLSEYYEGNISYFRDSALKELSHFSIPTVKTRRTEH